MVANRLRALRKGAGLTLGQLVEVSGVARGTIAEMERRPQHNVTVRTIVRLARALDACIFELLGAGTAPDVICPTCRRQHPDAVA